MGIRQRTKEHHSGLATEVEMVKEAIHAAEEKVERALTCLWEELPSWQQDNHFIRSGYRHASYSIRKSFESLFYFHNETVNIYTHLLGALLFTSIGVFIHHTLPPRYPTSTSADILALFFFFLGSFLCLGMSATFHMISNHSEDLSRFSNKLDYLGIVAMIAGSYVPSIYYGFYCNPTLQLTYWAMIGTLGTICGTLSIHPHFRTPEYRSLRAGMYVLYGLSGIIPIFQGLYLYGLETLSKQISLKWLILEGIFYISGAGIYAARIPERWAPGSFDLVGASHQIFHILVLAAAGSHLVGVVEAFDYLHNVRGLEC